MEIETWVFCPKCSKAAIVSYTVGDKPNAKLTCTNCGHAHSLEHDGTFNKGKLHVEAAGYCPQCNYRGEYSRILEGYPERGEIRVRCPECNCAHMATIRNSRQVLSKSNKPVDTIFKLPLYFQIPCSGNVLYAYNPKHIAEIEAFVLKSHNRGHCQWLPKWIFQAKNREEVLAGLKVLRNTAHKN